MAVTLPAEALRWPHDFELGTPYSDHGATGPSPLHDWSDEHSGRFAASSCLRTSCRWVVRGMCGICGNAKDLPIPGTRPDSRGLALGSSVAVEQPVVNKVRHGNQSFVADPLAINTGHVISRVPHDVIDRNLIDALTANRFKRVP